MTPRLAIGAAVVVALNLTAIYLGSKAVATQERSDRVTVIYWEKWTGGEGEAMREIVDDFNKSQNRIHVKYLSISGVDRKTMLAASGGSPPDIAGIWQDQVIQFDDLGALSDLMPLAREKGITDRHYIKGYWDPLYQEGRLLGLPSTPASIGLYVRPDLVPKEFATPETFPKTLEGLDALSDRITKRGPQGQIVRAGFLPGNPGWWNWAWASYFGGSLMKDGQPYINSPENIRAFTWIQQYSKKYGAQAVQSFQSGFGNFSSPQDPFMDGKVAAEQNGVWKPNYIRLNRPDTPYFAVPFPYPADRPDLAGHANLSQDVLVIPTGAKHPREAFEFIAYVQKQPVMEKLCSLHGKNSPLAVVSREFERTHPNPYIKLFDQLARSPKAFNPPKTGMYPQISGEVNNAFQQVNSGLKEPEAALKEAQDRVMKLWKVYSEQVKTQ